MTWETKYFDKTQQILNTLQSLKMVADTLYDCRLDADKEYWSHKYRKLLKNLDALTGD